MPYRNKFVPLKDGVEIRTIGDCESLIDKVIIDIRIQTSERYVDFEINKKARCELLSKPHIQFS